jgi:hypothetical protein
MTRNLKSASRDEMDRQGACALLSATLGFLRKHKIPKQVVLASVRRNYATRKDNLSVRLHRERVRAYEEMGIVMSTWYTAKRFLDQDCRPVPLMLGSGSRSIAALVRAARVSIPPGMAADLMRQSSSVRFDGTDTFHAVRREFVLPRFEIPRAALVVERYLETLSRNSSPHRNKPVLLLERSCHVPAVNLKTIAPVLRDIKGRGSAFLNAVNGHIEGQRVQGRRPRSTGEMSVHVFAWTRPLRRRKKKH